MKKNLFFILLSVFLLSCSPSPDGPSEEPVQEPVLDYLNELEFPPFAFTLPQDWLAEKAADGDGYFLSFPDASYLQMTLQKDASASALPQDFEATFITEEGIAVYNVGCGGAYYCGNLSYNEQAYSYAFFDASLGGVSNGEERIAEILPSLSTVSQEDLQAFIETVHLVR